MYIQNNDNLRTNKQWKRNIVWFNPPSKPSGKIWKVFS